jgi:N-acetylglutamate synthase
MPEKTWTLAAIRGLEERAFNAWPALQTVVAEGWVMRFSAGYTKRANSINAWHPEVPVMTAVAEAGALYDRCRLPLVVRVSPLAGNQTDDDLDAARFSRADETIVMTCAIDAVGTETVNDAGTDAVPDTRADAPRMSRTRSGSGAVPRVIIERSPSDAWIAGYATANNVPLHHRATLVDMLANLKHPAAFVTVTLGDPTTGGQSLSGQPTSGQSTRVEPPSAQPPSVEPGGFGLAVAERGMVGLFDIVTIEAARRQGIGRLIVTSLMAWGQTQGATAAYLQVVATNSTAHRLYQTQGFTEAYRYHYRTAPAV